MDLMCSRQGCLRNVDTFRRAQQLSPVMQSPADAPRHLGTHSPVARALTGQAPHGACRYGRRIPNVDQMMALRLVRDAGLRREEVIAVILYTGPLVRVQDNPAGMDPHWSAGHDGPLSARAFMSRCIHGWINP